MRQAILFPAVFIFLSATTFGIDGPELADKMAKAENAAKRIHILDSLSDDDVAKPGVLAVLHSMASHPLSHGLPDEPKDGTADASFALRLLTKVIAADPLSVQTLTALGGVSIELELSSRRRDYAAAFEFVLVEGLKRPSDFRRSLIEMIGSPDPAISAAGLYLVSQAVLQAAILEGRPSEPLGPIGPLAAPGVLGPRDLVDSTGGLGPLGSALVNDALKSEVREYARRLVPLAQTFHDENDWDDLLGGLNYPDPLLAEIVRSQIRQFVANRPLSQYKSFLSTPLDSLNILDWDHPDNLQLTIDIFQAASEQSPLDFRNHRRIFEMTQKTGPDWAPTAKPDIEDFRDRLKKMSPGHIEWELKPALLFGRHLADEVEELKPKDRAKALSAVIQFLKENRHHLYARKAFVAFVDQLYHRSSSRQFIRARKTCRIVLERLGLR